MANRHLSRSLAMQVLFEWDFRELGDDLPDDAVTRISEEFAPGLDDVSFVENLVNGVVSKQEKLDTIIEKAAPDWPVEQIAVVDRNILRIGLYELLFGNKQDVPARVAINEAIELAKTFGGENSGRFVNGVLGAVYKELGEPDKNEVPKKKKRIKDIPYDQMPIEKLGGAVVYRADRDKIELALVHDVFGHWTLTKGHIEEGQTMKEGIAREAEEELSLRVKVGPELGFNEYIASDPEKGKLRKQVVYHLAEAENPDSIQAPTHKGGLDDAKWFAISEVPDLNMYDDILPIVTKAIKILVKKNDE